MARTKKIKQDFTYAVGRRRTASARVRLFAGKGETTVNGQSIEKYFPGSIDKSTWSMPLKVVDVSDKYYFSARVIGGGKRGQLEAVVHGVARSLAKINKEEFRPLLKKAGLLTRDERIRERRKVNTGGKARRQKQSPKR